MEVMVFEKYTPCGRPLFMSHWAWIASSIPKPIPMPTATKANQYKNIPIAIPPGQV